MMDAALHAIAEPHRRAILRLIRGSEMSAGEIAAHFDVSRPAISQHLKVLREAGLITERRDGTRRLYQLLPAGIEAVRRELAWLWDDGLERLKSVAEAEERRLVERGPVSDGSTRDEDEFEAEVDDDVSR